MARRVRLESMDWPSIAADVPAGTRLDLRMSVIGGPDLTVPGVVDIDRLSDDDIVKRYLRPMLAALRVEMAKRNRKAEK